MIIEGKHIYICSDAVGETAEAVVLATMRQFDALQIQIKRISQIKHEQEICQVIAEASTTGGFVAFTLVQPHLREIMREESKRLNIKAVDIMGPMMDAFIETFHSEPKSKPGLLHQLDENYFRRVEAIEFTVRCDDGRDPNCMVQADIVLIGVSRTSKTPLSIFLAHKGYKVANFPLVPEVKIPDELYQLPHNRVIGLTMEAEQMLNIRTERLKSVGLPEGSKYGTRARIIEELNYAQSVIHKIGCPTIDVTNKAIEETAGIILQHMNQ